MADTLIKINNSRDTDLLFDVAIQGLIEDESAPADVRFVVENINERYNLSIKCAKTDDGRWHAKIPSLNLESKKQPFQIEVIVDGYYFSPVAGTLELIPEPKVSVKESQKKPTVTASIKSAKVIKEDAPIDIGTVQFGPDQRFAESSKLFLGMLIRVAQVVKESVKSDGSVDEKHKSLFTEGIKTLKTAFDYYLKELSKKR